MAEALLGLVPSYGDALSNKPSIAQPDDLPAQLRRDLDTKKTPTRCEHVSATLEVPSTVEFSIRESDGDAQEDVDPTLGGVRTQVIDGQPVRIVRAHETIINQPHDNPAMQRAVAKHIVGLLSTVDESTWVVREVSRGQYGWTFTYICKDSVAMWNRQNGKTASKALIADYSQKELEPIISGRPAFDCRGILTIAFSKNSRTINVKYEHTPFHKTVGEMIENFRPLPPAAPPVPLIPAGDKPKKTKTPRKRKSEANGNGTSGQPKKKKKEKPEDVVDGDVAQEEADSNGQTTATVPTKADAAVQSGVHSHAVLNVPLAEAARRREVAIRLLSDSGVDPESLSTEQFSIFANQSPDLQKESLSMLVKYGAERLRIVHPNDAAATSPTSVSPPPQTTATEAEAGNAGATLESPTPTKKKRSRKSKPATDAEEEELVPAPAGTPLKQVSRGSCIACRRAKTKAAKKMQDNSAAPATNDDDDDAEAEPELGPEPAPEPVVETGEEEPDDIETIDYTSNMPVANMLTPAAEPPSQDYFNTGHNELAFSQNASNDLSMSHGVSSYPEPSTTVDYTEQHTATTSYAQPPSLTETATYTQPSADTTDYVHPTDTEDLGYLQTAEASNLNYNHSAVKNTRSTGIPTTRRSLPSEQPQQSTAENTAPSPNHTQNWHSMSPPKATNTVSPTMTARQRQSRKSAQASVPTTVVQQPTSHDNTQQAPAHNAMHQQWQQQQHRPSPPQQVAQVTQVPQTATPAQVSPFQAPLQAAPTKSRAGHRASTRTPVSEQRAASSQHIAPPSTQGTMDTITMNNAHSLSNAANYNTYNTTYSNARSTTTDADTRLAYQPHTAQTASAKTSTYPSYDYNRGNNTSQSTNLAYTPSNDPRSGQLFNTQSQTSHTQSYSSNSNTNTSAASSYARPSSTASQQPSTLQSFNSRVSANTSQIRSSTRPNNQQQQQQQQHQQQHQHQQQPHQPDQHNWYGFGSGSNTSFTPANASGGYATRGSAPANYGAGSSNASQAYQQQQHNTSVAMPGHTYVEGDNEMYELLKNSLHGPGR
ncbi:C6 finger domain-containing protein [Colletotrichum tofieldiae]|nr:C6 finger domain-containing protein [Colletotrichum tofieldiae]